MWDSACQAKKTYPAEHTARLAAQDSIRRSDSDVKRLWVYECRACQGWHLTRQQTGRAVTSEDLGL